MTPERLTQGTMPITKHLLRRMTVAKGKKETGEQLELIDVGPKNLKEILAAVIIYKKHQKTRLSALKDETTEKQHVLELVKAAKLKPLTDGVIRFECGGEVISIEPRDEVIRIKKVKASKKPTE